jgi:hypothetical protein
MARNRQTITYRNVPIGALLGAVFFVIHPKPTQYLVFDEIPGPPVQARLLGVFHSRRAARKLQAFNTLNNGSVSFCVWNDTVSTNWKYEHYGVTPQ